MIYISVHIFRLSLTCETILCNSLCSAYCHVVFAALQLTDRDVQTCIDSLTAVCVIPVKTGNTAVYIVSGVIQVISVSVVNYADEPSALIIVCEFTAACVTEIIEHAVLSRSIDMIYSDTLALFAHHAVFVPTPLLLPFLVMYSIMKYSEK